MKSAHQVLRVARSLSSRWSDGLLGTVGLAVIGAAAYWPFYAPILFSDDWSEIAWWSTRGLLHWATLDRVPLQITPRWLQYTLFGLNVDAYYALLWTTGVLSAVLLFFLLKRILPGQPVVAFAAAALFLVYPANHVHMWLSCIHIWVAACLALGYALLLWRYYESGRARWIIGALACLAASLLSYEGPFGVALAFPLLLLLKTDIPLRRRIAGIAWPFALGLVYSLWRNVMLPRAVDIRYDLEYLMLPPARLWSRLVQGVKILVFGWTDPLARLAGWRNTEIMALGLGLLVCLCWLGVAAWFRARRSEPVPLVPKRGTAVDLRSAAGLLAAGLALVLAGYLPTILAVEPKLANVDSRVSILAGLGASVALAAALWIGAELLSRSRGRVGYYVLAGVTPLLVVAIGIQVSVQYANRAAWEDERQILGGLLSYCPSLEKDTFVLVVLTGFGDRFTWEGEWQRTPLEDRVDLTPALRILYGDDTLSGDVVYPDVVEMNEIPGRDWRSPTADVLTVAYDRSEKWLSYPQLQAAFPELAATSVYLSNRCRPTVPADPARTRWRTLVTP